MTISPPANTVGRVCLPKLGLHNALLLVDGVRVIGIVQNDYVCAEHLAPAKGMSTIVVTRGAQQKK